MQWTDATKTKLTDWYNQVGLRAPVLQEMMRTGQYPANPHSFSGRISAGAETAPKTIDDIINSQTLEGKMFPGEPLPPKTVGDIAKNQTLEGKMYSGESLPPKTPGDLLPVPLRDAPLSTIPDILQESPPKEAQDEIKAAAKTPPTEQEIGAFFKHFPASATALYHPSNPFASAAREPYAFQILQKIGIYSWR